jgi:hypothetical protein
VTRQKMLKCYLENLDRAHKGEEYKGTEEHHKRAANPEIIVSNHNSSRKSVCMFCSRDSIHS